MPRREHRGGPWRLPSMGAGGSSCGKGTRARGPQGAACLTTACVIPTLPRPTPTASFDVVAAVARLIGETLELRQVFARVAKVALGALAFDRMGVLLLEGADGLRHYAVAAADVDGPADEEGRLRPRDDCSPRLWRDFVVDRID